MRAADREFVFAAVADERRRIASLLDGLNDIQLGTPSLCAGWDVKTVRRVSRRLTGPSERGAKEPV